MPNQMKKYFQFAPDIPVNRYKQKVRPSKGISDKFFINEKTASTIQINQKMIVAILTADDWNK